MLVVEVVPTVATMQQGRRPAVAIARDGLREQIGAHAELGVARDLTDVARPKPSAMAPFSTEECAWSDV